MNAVIDHVRVELGARADDPAPDYDAVISEWADALGAYWLGKQAGQDTYAFEWLRLYASVCGEVAVSEDIAYAHKILTRLREITHDTYSSASCQHYIETGRYMTRDEVEFWNPMSWSTP